MKHAQKGFTLVEVVVVLPVMIVAIAITITFMVNLMLSIGTKNANIALQSKPSRPCSPSGMRFNLPIFSREPSSLTRLTQMSPPVDGIQQKTQPQRQAISG